MAVLLPRLAVMVMVVVVFVLVLLVCVLAGRGWAVVRKAAVAGPAASHQQVVDGGELALVVLLAHHVCQLG